MAKVAGLMGQIKALHEQVQQVEVRHSSLQGLTWSFQILVHGMSVVSTAGAFHV